MPVDLPYYNQCHNNSSHHSHYQSNHKCNLFIQDKKYQNLKNKQTIQINCKQGFSVSVGQINLLYCQRKSWHSFPLLQYCQGIYQFILFPQFNVVYRDEVFIAPLHIYIHSLLTFPKVAFRT